MCHLQVCSKSVTIYLNASEATMQARLQRRSTSSGRIDDNPDSIAKRLRTFNENNAEVLQHLREQGQVFNVRTFKGRCTYTQ
jgi:adenylate kinase family enzyme